MLQDRMGKQGLMYICTLSLVSVCITASLAQVAAPTSQPSRSESNVRTSCNDWKKDAGREGECQIETEATTWKVSFYKEGTEKRSLKNFIKNLLVIFPPDGSTHKVHEWWDSLVGPGKAIDTRQWMVLSLGYPSSDNSKIAQSLFQTTEEILKVELAVIDSLYTQRKDFVVGGPSRGAQVALLLSQTMPKDVMGIFLIHFHGGSEIDFDFQDAKKALSELDQAEASAGPYENWPKEKKADWWTTRMGKEVLALQYTEKYFLDPTWMVDVNMTPAQYKGPDPFKTETVRLWVEYFRDNEHPRPLYQRALVLSESTKALTPADYQKTPKRVLLVANKLDQTFLLSAVEKFQQALTLPGKQVTFQTIEDVRGHTACCVPNMPIQTADILGKWLQDL